MHTTAAGTPGTTELHVGFTGERIPPRHAEYDEARALPHAAADRRPAEVLRPHGAADVIDAVDYARRTGQPMAVRSGGLGVADAAGAGEADGGLLLDLSAMKGVRVDIDRGTARANAGVLWGEFDRETQLFDLATPGGRVTTTGLGGHVLGGGYGWLSPLHGLSCDNLLGADVVTADGRFLRVSVDQHQDLLWALRGAGVGFGVVTSFEMRLHRVTPQVLAGFLVLPNDARALEASRAYRDVVEAADPRLVTALATYRAWPGPGVPEDLAGKPVLAVVVVWAGDPEEGAAAVAPLRAALPGAVDLVRPTRYAAAQAMLDRFAPREGRFAHRGLHLAALTDEVLDGYVTAGRSIRSAHTLGAIYRNGGAVGRVPEGATAAGHRTAPYLAHPSAWWGTPEEGAHERAWLAEFTDAVAPAATGGTYGGLEPGTSPEQLLARHGEDVLRRLTALKDAYDPEHLLRGGVPPTGWRPTAVPRQRR